VSPRLQAVILSGVLVGASAFAYVGASRLSYERIAAKKAAEAARAGSISTNLEQQVAALQKKLTAFSHDREQAQRQVAMLGNQVATLRNQLSATASKLQSLELTDSQFAHPLDDIEELFPVVEPEANSKTRQKLDETKQALGLDERAQSAALTAQLGKMQADRAAEQAQFANDKARLEQTAKALAQLGAAQNKWTMRRDWVRARLGEIWQQLSQIELSLSQPGSRGVAADDDESSAGGPIPPSNGRIGLADLGLKEITEFERALRSAGVNVARILSLFGTALAEGGPYVPPPKGERATADAISPEKLVAIQSLAKSLPVSAPLAQYEIASPFGARVDPFKSRPSFHTGVDMDAPYSSPVYSAASGTVIYAGWLGDYGKAVEIDHGFGIVTLYGHLRRSLVFAGQNVAAQAEIGLVGTTGRSTGPHVHYEVRVDGQPQDPEKFLALARLLPAPARPLTPTAAGPTGNSR
jgi:murein DD-endopeptidase MepM/ murein hydrolase activator NlpD